MAKVWGHCRKDERVVVAGSAVGFILRERIRKKGVRRSIYANFLLMQGIKGVFDHFGVNKKKFYVTHKKILLR